MKIQSTLPILFTFFLIANLSAQTNALIVSNNILLPRDTVLRKELLTSLDGFLSQKEKANSENTFVSKGDLLETSALLDEMKAIERNDKLNDDHFYKGYLTNVIRLKDTAFLVQFAYVGVSDGVSQLRATFTLMARKNGKQFCFLSPLKYNTKNWHNRKIESATVYFKDSLNNEKAGKYFQLANEFDRRLNAPILPTEFYCCDNFQESLRLLGVDYKLDYNGKMYNSLNAKENNVYLELNGTLTSDFTAYDPHDLWHSRLHNVLSTSIINRPVDEGTAYLYGGSWGLTWDEILAKFKQFAKENPKADWVALYNESKNFDEKSTYPLNVDFVINALIVQQLEKEKGFSAVMELLSCGKKEKDNANYFAALEKISGVKKSNFNSYVWKLIKAS